MTLQPATTSPAPPALGGVHHIAQVTSCPEETLRFYRDTLGFPLLHTVSATGWLSNDYPDFIHFFFGLGKGCHLAFFYFFSDPDEKPPSALIRQSKHIAFAVDTEEELRNWRERLKSHGIKVTPPLTHELVESIYFEDPNGIQLEIARPLRAFTDIDARDAELTLDALLSVLKSPDPTLRNVWRRKGELVQDRIRTEEP
jgi:catechol 2,3-dioxygenase-like lactoylglutathione lyase family enzyme